MPGDLRKSIQSELQPHHTQP
ncbi:unnamed protein product [Staurois parvus]|uniref:Uncharacterized protein n=1 Tax=Staurois parvus TaxID=386267 RepID=A0ABN9AFP8_9NEOB|nr:unnamed protein product [Staurois parvus]